MLVPRYDRLSRPYLARSTATLEGLLIPYSYRIRTIGFVGSATGLYYTESFVVMIVGVVRTGALG